MRLSQESGADLNGHAQAASFRCTSCGRSFGTVSARNGHVPTHHGGRTSGLKDAESRCPGSGMRMASRSYKVRKIEPADRSDNEFRIKRAEARGDSEEASLIRASFGQWEKEQGQQRERIVCAVCGSAWLTPTTKGTARPHRRDDAEESLWEKVRTLRKDIHTLQTELDRVLEKLEP